MTNGRPTELTGDSLARPTRDSLEAQTGADSVAGP